MMDTLLEFSNAVSKIKSAINELEVKGDRNATLIVYSNKLCDEIQQGLYKASQTAPTGAVEVAEGETPPESGDGA
jgi:hypothetical protein